MDKKTTLDNKIFVYAHAIAVLALMHVDAISREHISNSICTGHATEVVDRYQTVRGSQLVFLERKNSGGGEAKWICLNERIIASAREDQGAAFYSFVSPMLHGSDNIEFRRIYQGQRPDVSRMVVQEDSGPHVGDNHYWLFDFRRKEPLIVGPFGRCDNEEEFVVHWGEEEVEILLGGENAAQSFVYHYKTNTLEDTSPIDVCDY